jgi:hypothetical protein
MACPLFEPTEKLPWARWKGRFRPPLGSPYRGLCHATAEAAVPPDEVLLDCCNMGYARGRCGRFSGDGPDAMRFEIATADAKIIEVAWLAERNCLPAAQGTAMCDRASDRWLNTQKLGLPLRRQLDAYLREWIEAGEGS